MNNIFLWENFGPMHVDRCEAVAKSGLNVTGLELYGRSDTYDWIPENGQSFKKVTLFSEGRPRGIALIKSLIAYRLKNGKANWFFSHYDWKEIFIFAAFLRLIGDKVYTMGCSKFDDWPRTSVREALKRPFFWPYRGALGSGIRSKEFFHFHGFKENEVQVECNTLSLERIRNLSGTQPAPFGIPFEDRHFTIVARLVPKKNLHMALDAYAKYKEITPAPRLLHICGSGPLEKELKEKACHLNIENEIIFHGFIQTQQIAQLLGSSLALILPSKEEQFGNVVIEAQAMGLPVLLSDVCGARDRLVRSAVNGFIFEPDNPEGLAWFMNNLTANKKLWNKMCLAATNYGTRGDVASFANGIHALINNTEKK